MIVTIGLTLFFGKSYNLAAAYGIAVSATMLMTSALLFIAMREIWGWSLLASGAIAGAFLCVDASFFLANLVKVADGGYVPLLLASIVYGVMLICAEALAALVGSDAGSLSASTIARLKEIWTDEHVLWLERDLGQALCLPLGRRHSRAGQTGRRGAMHRHHRSDIVGERGIGRLGRWCP
jgi:hypothetical protein